MISNTDNLNNLLSEDFPGTDHIGPFGGKVGNRLFRLFRLFRPNFTRAESMSKKHFVGVNSNRRRVGEGHPRAVLSDADCNLIREIYAEGFASYRTLARQFEVSRVTIRDIVTGRRRGDEPVDFVVPKKLR